MQSLIIHMKDPTPLYNFNYFINTNIYNNVQLIFFKKNQFKRKSTRYIDLNLIFFPLYSTRTLQVNIFKIHGKKRKLFTQFKIFG